MDPIQRFERKGEAQRRQRAQRRRTGLLRSRVVALSLISFVFLWGVVFAQMATGNDPVLGSSKGARAAAGAARSETKNDGEEATGASAAANEAIGSTDPEETEPEYAESEYAEPEYEYVEPEYAESEYAEPEYAETEPAPVVTSQS
jgi:hypothetical protein